MDETTKETQRAFAWSLTEDEIITVAKKQPPATARGYGGYAITGLMYPPQSPLIYIKYGRQRVRDPEARTHQFAFEALQQIPPADRQGIHIPEIYRVVRDQHSTYIVMELVLGKTLAHHYYRNPAWAEINERLYAKVEKALRLFLSFQVPQDVLPGPCGGGIIRHPLFKYGEAKIHYDSLDMLEKHINKVATHLPSQKTNRPTVQLERELHFVYSDLFENNFMFTDEGEELYVIDFEHAGFLPISFMTYAFTQYKLPCHALREKFDLPQHNMPAMKQAGYLFGVATDKIGRCYTFTSDMVAVKQRLTQLSLAH